MAKYLSQEEEVSFDSHLKALDDDELLDFWAETQHLENLLQLEFDTKVSPAQDYEKMIIHELQMRSSKRNAFSR